MTAARSVAVVGFLAGWALCGPAAGQVLVRLGASDNLASGSAFADLLSPAPLNPLPEPAALLLLCCGAVILLARPRRRPTHHPPRVPPPSSRGPGRFPTQQT